MKKNCSARKENDKPTFGAEKVFGDFDNKIWISRYIIISFPTDAIHETMTYYLNCIRWFTRFLFPIHMIVRLSNSHQIKDELIAQFLHFSSTPLGFLLGNSLFCGMRHCFASRLGYGSMNT